MTAALFRVTQSFWMHGRVQRVGRLIRIVDPRLIAPLFIAGQIEPAAHEAVAQRPARPPERDD